MIGVCASVIAFGIWQRRAFMQLTGLLGSSDPIYFEQPISVWLRIASNPNEDLEAVPALIQALGAWKMQVRLAAAEALGAIGPKARSAIPALRAALEDPWYYVHIAAKEALLLIDVDQVESK